MCGIVGWLGPRLEAEFDAGIATRMCERLRHRGPDSGGQWLAPEGGAWLGHRRLAVLDLSAHGHQPMLSDESRDARHVLSFNGEVYNYKLLRRELEQSGCSFLGDSDTEVVLKACVTWGIEAATARFEGMFAFALYDRTERCLWLARDPLGIKPLYYTASAARLAFASELTPLLELPGMDRSIDQDALFAYFRYGNVPAPASILRGVRKLPAGQLLRYQQGEVQIRPCRSLDTMARAARQHPLSLSLAEATDELEQRLRQAVRQHMQSDVPYGAFLSGGVDSSTVVAMMQAESSQPVKTFTIGFSESSHDESAHARKVAAHLGTDHHEMILNPNEIPAMVPTVAGFFDEPFADNSALPTWLVSRFARESVTVCLSGDGGDELFGGYPRYFWARRIEALRARLTAPGARLAAGALRAMPAVFWDEGLNRLLGKRYAGSEGLAARVRRFAAYLGCRREDAYAQTMSIWSDPAALIGHQPSQALGADAHHYPELSWADEMMLIDQGNYLQDDILAKVDRASMAVSLEARVPLLTHPMLEFSWRLPASMKFAAGGDRGKLLLREVLYRHVPRALIERPKQGFGMPVATWLRGPLRDWAEHLLQRADLESCGLNADVVGRVWREHQAGQDRQGMLWTVLMYRQWHQRLEMH
jgi:asparagine synthase (glutamine-hydrolysing)